MTWRPLRVCLDARLAGGISGGLEQATIGLAYGLSQLTDGNEEYDFLTFAGHDQWIRPYLKGPCRALATYLRPQTRLMWRLERIAPQLVPLLRVAQMRVASGRGSSVTGPRRSDGTIERASVDVMHFTTQSGFLTDVPAIYQPWDLQHLHYPQYFPEQERQARDVWYRALCEQSDLVVVASEWGKRDLLQHYGLPEQKVAVVPIAPAAAAYPLPTDEDIARTRGRLSLPCGFVYYPAQTWPHKNHLNLLEAIADLRNRWSVSIPLVCSGHMNGFYPTVAKHVRQLRLDGQVRFVGFVDPVEVQCLYRLARAMVFPSKFEGWGMPVSEAFLAGTPVACSSATSLPEQAGDGALMFDPDRSEEIAECIYRLWTDESLRQMLVERGRRNVARFSWERTARMFRAHYRQTARRALTEEDQALLSSPPLL